MARLLRGFRFSRSLRDEAGMNNELRCCVLAGRLAAALPGCVAVGFGRGAPPTIADEIKALKEARDDGELTCDEYQMGLAALHSRQTH
jgi:hypothetical protein